MSNGNPIRPGDYKCRAIASSVQWIASGDGATDDALSIELDVFERGSAIGRMRTKLKFDDAKATKFSLLKLRSLGARGADPFELSGLGEREADAVVKRLSHEGNDFTVIDVKVASAAVPLDDQRKAALRERLRAAAVEVPDLPPEDEPPNDTPTIGDPNRGDDDIPF